MSDSLGLSGGKIMAIRFSCPSCNQPIEIEDAWAGQSVACPYCKNVVTAPVRSNWPPSEVPMAAPTTSAFTPPPPPGASRQASQPATWTTPAHAAPFTSSSAGWALTLAVTSAALAVIGWFLWLVSTMGPVIDQVGPEATPQEMQEKMQELVSSGDIAMNPAIAILGVVGLLCAIGGVALAIHSILRSEPRRVMAITACVLGACFLFCQILLTLSVMSIQAMAGG